MHRIGALDPAACVPHALHAGDRIWPESNCYVDLWIGLLHSHGLEPLAALPFTLGIDLEGDQWTFFKFPLADLYALYGIDVFELTVWRPLAAHVEEQLALGRPLIPEIDAYYLPDTSGTSYRTDHVKTSIAIEMIDVADRRLGYFHNAGYYELQGADFAGAFRLEGHLANPEYLAPYVEVAKLAARAPLAGEDLVAASLRLLREHLRRRPAVNPFRRYAERFPHDLTWLSQQGLATFHAYAFATLRQCGADFELAAAYLHWLESQGECSLTATASAFEKIASTAKTLQFRTARLVNNGKPYDPAPMLEAMAAAWETGMAALLARYPT